MHGKSLLVLTQTGHERMGSKCQGKYLIYELEHKQKTYTGTKAKLNQTPNSYSCKPWKSVEAWLAQAGRSRLASPGASSFHKAGKCFAGVRPRTEAPQRVGCQWPPSGKHCKDCSSTLSTISLCPLLPLQWMWRYSQPPLSQSPRRWDNKRLTSNLQQWPPQWYLLTMSIEMALPPSKLRDIV